MKRFEFDDQTIYSFDWDFISSHMYMIMNGSEAAVIDPVNTSEALDFMLEKGIRRVHAVLTHEHFDHISGTDMLCRNFDTTIYISKMSAPNAADPSKNHSDKTDVLKMFNPDFKEKTGTVEPFFCIADITFDDRFELTFGNNKLTLVRTPGHTAGSICIILNDRYLFSGDTLLDTPTITRLPGGSRRSFSEETLPFLRSLKEHIKIVFPGHGRTGTLEELLEKYEH
ncbi:MAG: MBL fold metallo-hydrolase [Huintestinicola sp.]